MEIISENYNNEKGVLYIQFRKNNMYLSVTSQMANRKQLIIFAEDHFRSLSSVG